MSHQSSHIYEFGPFRMDSAERMLLRNGETIPLQPKAFDLLRVLVEHRGHLLEKDELLRAIWPDTIVEEVNLANNISVLRKALGEGGNGQRFIETVSRRGYRFVAPVVEKYEGMVERGMTEIAQAPIAQREAPVAAATGEAPQRAPRRWAPRRPGLAISLGVLLLVGVAGAVIFWSPKSRPAAPADQIKSLAVMPLENLSGDPTQEYFADGMTDALIGELTKIGALRVISRTSSMRYKGTRRLLPEIARELNVEAVIEGTVQRLGNRVLVRAKLVHGASEQALWSRNWDHDLRDVLKLQSEIAQAVVREIQIKLTPAEQTRLSGARPINPEAYEAYLKGVYWTNQGVNAPTCRESEESHKKSFGYFEQAIKIAPDYAHAFAGLGASYHWLASCSASFGDFYPKARAAVQQALALDETLAEAHVSLAFIRLYNEWDFAGAEREINRAIELNPNTSYAMYGLYLSEVGRHTEAIAAMKRAQELDPLTLPIKQNLGLVYMQARQYDLVIEHARHLLDLTPNDAGTRAALGTAYVYQRRYDEGLAEIQKAIEKSGTVPEGLRGRLAWAYAAAGKRSEALRLLDELTGLAQQSPSLKVSLARTYAMLGQRDQAFEWLERAYKVRANGLLALNNFPEFDSLHSDPRWKELLHLMKFPQDQSLR